ncbi:hypothetical protein M6B38_277600 [Iris pallida]|uniref:Uncharacterized protein n=1 Tax=Iris pallida TaxID=29817 RepID=A0AAX6FEC4_IRIPA|nr:hypothetical protein M6B38_137225 [Iris pallida]KAJ6847455.1 hypothetical protein M6B38_277600 [Iris pallida]
MSLRSQPTVSRSHSSTVIEIAFFSVSDEGAVASPCLQFLPLRRYRADLDS